MNLSRSYIIFVLKLFIGFSIFFVILNKIKISDLLQYIKKVDYMWILGAYISSNISMIFSSIRSYRYLNDFGLRIKFIEIIKLYYRSSLLNIILPGGIGGDGYKIYILFSRYAFSKIQGIRVIFYERLNGITALIFIGLIISLFSDDIRGYTIIPCIENFIFISILLIIPSYILVSHYLFKDRYQTAKEAMLYSIIVQLFQVSMIYCIIKSLSEHVNNNQVINYIIIYIVSSIVSIIPISIGGMGIKEATFYYVTSNENLFTNMNSDFGVLIAMLSFIIYIFTALLGSLNFNYKIKNNIEKLE